MAQNYRLTAKPGLNRAGRFVRTKSKPVIIINRPNVARVPQSQKITKEQQPQKVVIRPPTIAPIKNRNVAVARPKRRGVSRRVASQARERKEKHQAQYLRHIKKLKDIGVGRILIMVACGPSILEIDLKKLQQHPLVDVMAINKPDPRMDPPDYWVFCDQSQYLRNRTAFESFQNTVINAWSVKARHKNQVLIRNKPGRGFSKDLMQGYYIGRSTTFANMQTAFWMNYDKIFIFGCDMSPTQGSLHFYGTNPDVKPEIRVQRFSKEAEYYLSGAKQLTPQERMKFYFCSSYNKWPFVDHFKRMDHIAAPDKIMEMADALGKQK